MHRTDPWRAAGDPASLGPLSVRQGRDRYLAANGFTIAGYTEPTFTLDFAGWKLRFKNPPARQRVVPLHDLHHVATGYGTDFVGEAEIGAWELRAGCTTPFLYVINGLAVLIGLVVAPLRTLRAFRRARGQRTLYGLGQDYEELLALTVGELRQRLGVPPEGQADRPAGLHREAPGLGSQAGSASERPPQGE